MHRLMVNTRNGGAGVFLCVDQTLQPEMRMLQSRRHVPNSIIIVLLWLGRCVMHTALIKVHTMLTETAPSNLDFTSVLTFNVTYASVASEAAGAAAGTAVGAALGAEAGVGGGGGSAAAGIFCRGCCRYCCWCCERIVLLLVLPVVLLWL